MKRKEKIWFSGIWAVPLGIALIIVYYEIVSHLRSPGYTGSFLSMEDYRVMLVLLVLPTTLIFLSNLYKYIIIGQRSFSPLKKITFEEITRDKIRAQNRPIKEEFLFSEPRDFVLGKRGRRFVALPIPNDPEAMMILGPPGSRKTSIILSWLIYYFNFTSQENRKLQAMLVVDCKPELSRLSVFEGREDVEIINPSHIDSVGFDVFYDLSEESTDDELHERCDIIVRTLIINQGGDNAFFYVSAQRILLAVLMYGFRKGWGFIKSINHAMSVAVEDIIAEILADEEMKEHPRIQNLVRVYDGRESDAFDDVAMTMQQDLAIFSTSSCQHFFSEDNPKRVSPEDLVAGKSIFIAIEDKNLEMYKTIFRLVVTLSTRHLISIPEGSIPGQKPVAIVCDEAGSIYIPDLLSVLARARSKKVLLMLIAQAYSQFELLYGRDEAKAIRENCKSHIILSCRDTDTAKTISGWCGTYKETKISKNRSLASMLLSSDTSENITTEDKPIFNESDLLSLESDNKVLVFNKGDWFCADKITYRDIPFFYDFSEVVKASNDRLNGKMTSENSVNQYAGSHFLDSFYRWKAEQNDDDQA